VVALYFTLGKGLHVVKTLLVVDDYEDLRKLVVFFLSARGYAVLEAPTGRMVIHAAIEGNPNLILLELRLPDMNGIEVARELQKIPETTHIPVTAWTADYRAPAESRYLAPIRLIRLYFKNRFRCENSRLRLHAAYILTG